MMTPHSLSQLQALFQQWSGEAPLQTIPLPISGSDRRYARLVGASHSLIGTFHTDDKENRSFVELSRHFKKAGLNVPEVYAERLEEGVYLQQDLGNQTLLDLLQEERRLTGEAMPAKAMEYYRQAVRQLANIQTDGAQGLGHLPLFDKQSMLLDLYYFKYYFVKFLKIPHDEDALEADFHQLADFLSTAPNDYFLYRDFQARNILVHEGQVWFIDFQSGKRGPSQYDLASLLHQAKAALPDDVREELLLEYLRELNTKRTINEQEFRNQYKGFVLLRNLQVLGSYGFRGIFERRQHFLDSIPFGIENIRRRLAEGLPGQMPELQQVLEALAIENGELRIENEKQKPLGGAADPKESLSILNYQLSIQICSFSYMKGIPKDNTTHGGGFVFDCRGVHNPGRFEEYKMLTGLDESVKTFLKDKTEMPQFLEHVFAITGLTVEDYLARQREHLSINFGCTGGRHRSVFAAEATAKYLREKYGVRVELTHREKGSW